MIFSTIIYKNLEKSGELNVYYRKINRKVDVFKRLHFHNNQVKSHTHTHTRTPALKHTRIYAHTHTP